MIRQFPFIVCTFIAGLPCAYGQTRIDVLIPATVEGWTSKTFKGNTQYQPTLLNGTAALKAEARASASGLFREIKIDLNKTPVLNWRWYIEDTFSGNDERTKNGDDYPARIYVVISGGAFFWRTKALNYVWSSHQPVGTHWPNAFTGNAQMLAVTTGTPPGADWVTVKRNVRDDLKQVFGQDFKTLDVVALMTDADNTGQSVTAYYGEVYFTAE